MVHGIEKVQVDGVPMEPIAVPPKVAAKLCSISVRSLYRAKSRGDIRFKKVGNLTLFPVDGLREWMNKTGGV